MENFCCTIETEPRTLNQGQLNDAREMAAEILNSKEAGEQASRIIIEMQVVKSIKATVAEEVSGGNPPQKAAGLLGKREKIESDHVLVVTNCQCTSSALTMESTTSEDSRIKEPLSAPF
ncbi:DA1-related protein 5 [Striga asiatica]|uniref:DA1-related protein 5 n=1 Tax=Striga asiatica TaxID=4170 RepID=A0A5A7QKI5_STRAF|nr:DA1-related protein 5 [Striga asiatica]